jgi:thiol-disulfide isomerase/thioredoxin
MGHRKNLKQQLTAFAGSLLLLTANAQFEKQPVAASKAVRMADGQDLNGQPWSAQAAAGKLMVVNFWATWCAPCKEELPTLQTLQDLRGDDLLVLGVNVREPVSRVRRYLQSTGIHFLNLSDSQGQLARQFDVTIYPTSLIFNRQGLLVWRITGEVDWSGAQPQAWLDALQNPH